MNTKADHLKYLKQLGEFNIRCSYAIFSNEEIEILKKYGNWFEGLTNGALKPLNPAQERFIEVSKGNKNPESLHEKAWFKYTGRKKLEESDPEKFHLDYHIEEQSFYTRDGYYKLHPSRNKSM